MTEMYWITRLNALNGFFAVATGISTAAWAIFLACWLCNVCEAKDCENNRFRKDEAEAYRAYAKLFKKTFFCTVFIAALAYAGLIFIPTTKQAFAIYGIGGTIDYIKSNEKARQLPDKCIEALTRYVDSITKEDKKNN